MKYMSNIEKKTTYRSRDRHGRDRMVVEFTITYWRGLQSCYINSGERLIEDTIK
jgi:hypothetical protein